jgi:ribose/xylose/arabinose/galactoside ABC-type transport system permease subunit
MPGAPTPNSEQHAGGATQATVTFPGGASDAAAERISRPATEALRTPGRELVRHLPILIALGLIVIIGWRGSSAFLTSSDMLNIVSLVAPLGIMAGGTAVLMIAGEIDLSIGSAASLISILAAKSVNGGTAGLIVTLEAMAAGLVLGLVIGTIITATRATPFMVTLGFLSILAGVAAAWTDNQPVLIRSGFTTIGSGRLAGIPVSALVFAGVMMVLYLLLYHLKPGRLIFATGGNEEAARLAGIPVDAIRIGVYTLNGALVGLGAAILTSLTGSGDPSLGSGLELQVIAAVVIGGATLAGGDGSLLGATLGVLLLGTITTVLNLVGAASYVATIVYGGFIVLAVGLRGARVTRAIGRVRGAIRSRRRGPLRGRGVSVG